MRILDKHTSKNVLVSYLFILMVLSGLYLIIDLFSCLSDILGSKTPIPALVNYYFYMLPLIIARISPFSLLISVLYTIGESNKHNEIMTMRSCGISILRISTPILVTALVISVLFFFVQEKILIVAHRKTQDIKARLIKQNTSGAAEEKDLAFYSMDMIFFAKRFLPKEKTLNDVVIFKEDDKKNISVELFCKSITYENNAWIADDVIECKLDKEGNIIGAPLHFRQKNIELTEKPHELVFKKDIYAQFYSLKNLRKEMRRLKRIKAFNLLASITVDYHNKIAEPFSHFFIIIGVLPLALEIRKRTVILSSLGTGFIFSFFYYVATAISLNLAKTTSILPVLGAWIVPLFFITAGISTLLLTK